VRGSGFGSGRNTTPGTPFPPDLPISWVGVNTGVADCLAASSFGWDASGNRPNTRRAVSSKPGLSAKRSSVANWPMESDVASSRVRRMASAARGRFGFPVG
jgi:hypothetical protein